MIGAFYAVHRKAVVAGALGLCALLVVAGVIVVDHGSRQAPPSGGPVRPQLLPHISPSSKTQAPIGHGYHPRYVEPPSTAKQLQLAAALTAAESPEQIAAGQAIRMPPGHYSPRYPAVPGTDTTDEFTYTKAWVSELLDVNYRSQTRAGLLAWAIAGEAADTLPGIPANVEDKALYASLASRAIGGGIGHTPLPTSPAWAGMAARGIVQRVSGVEVAVDPAWTRLVGEGFVPTDPLFSFVDVSGTLTTTAESTKPSSRTFRMVLAVGSALHHPGYGAVSVDDWSVSSWPVG